MTRIFIFICLNLLFHICNGFLGFFGKHNKTATARPEPLVPNATKPIDLPGNDDIDPVEAEAGAIAGAVFGVLVCMGFIVFAGIMYIRRKRERDLEYNRQTKVLKQSSQNAGVYMDTTQESINTARTRTSKSQGQEYRSLQKDSNMYESDSEDEL